MEAFPRIPVDPRCHECIERAEDKLKIKQVDAQRRMQLEMLLGKLHSERTGLVTITAMATGLIERFGGIGSFLDIWYRNLDILLQQNMGTDKAVRACEAIAKLIMQANALEGARRTPERMSTEELEGELLVEMARIMDKNTLTIGEGGNVEQTEERPAD